MSFQDENKVNFSRAELLTVFACCSLLLLTVYRSGTMTDYGLSFWGPNGHDAVFHIAVIRSISENLNFSNPLMFGESIKNYHLGFDLLVALVYKITGLNIFDLFFRWLPLVISATLAFTVLATLKKLGFGKYERIFGLICFSLLGSLGFLKTMLSDPFAGESVFWANQSASMLLNPPFAISLVGLFAWIYIITDKKKLPVWIYLIPSLMFHIKAYAGLLMIGALSIETIFNLVTKRQSKYRSIFVLILALVVFYISVSAVLGGSSLISFEPLWFVKQMLTSTDRLYNARMASALDNWLHAGSLIKLATLQTVALVVFLIGNLGIRLLGLKSIFETNKTIAQRLIMYITVLGLLVPLFFVQKGTPWNTIQFMYYSLALSGVYTGKYLVNKLAQSRNIIYFSGWIFLMLLGMLTSVGTFRDYLSKTPASYVSRDEIALLSTTQRLGLIYRPFATSDKRLFNAPLPLYVYESTAYVGMFGKAQCYLCDEVNLTIMGYDFGDRLNKSKIVYGSGDNDKIASLLDSNRLDYLYLDPLSFLKFDPSTISYRMIASKGGFSLWQKTK